MYITIRKEFFKEFFINNGTEYACAVDMNNIKVHKKFDSAMKYHQKFFEEFRNKYGEFITNSPRIIWEGKNMITTEFVTMRGNGTVYRTLLITTKKNYED